MSDEEQHALRTENFDTSADALDSLTTAAQVHDDPPIQHIHASAAHEKSHKWLQKMIPKDVLDNMESKHHMGNYVIDRKTGEKTFEAMSVYVRLGMHFLYYGSEQEKLLHTGKALKLLKAQSEKMGVQYDAPESKAHIEPFIKSFALEASMAEMVKSDPADYATFNEFFAREIKESARPVAEPEDESVTSSPADCRLTAFPSISLATEYWIKGRGFTVQRLLGISEDEASQRGFDGGSIVIARLAPQDYHRFHAPVDGTVESIKDIPGSYYTVNPQAINESGSMDVFCENKRSVMTVRRKGTGNSVAIVAVGAMLVGSIFYVPGVAQEGAEIKRGMCLGGFKYGGSTVIVVYAKGEVVLDEDLVKNSTEEHCETLMQVGWRTGKST